MFRVLLVISLMLSVVFSKPIDRLPKPEFVTPEQKRVLDYACEVGKWFDDGEGNMCQVFQAITWRETRAGRDKGYKPDHPSFGIFQAYRVTIRNRLKQNGIHMSSEEIREMLMDDEASGYWAQVEMAEWLKYHKGDLRKSLASYNGGFGWKNTLWYADDVLSIAKYIEEAPHLK